MDSRTAVVFMLGYPGMGKRTVGSALAELLDAVLVDNQLINRPLLELFRWEGKESIPMETWERVVPIREAVLGTIEDLAPKTNSYVFTNVLLDDPQGAAHYERIRSVARKRGSLFLAVMLDCDIEVQVSRIDNPDRRALRKGSDPEGGSRRCSSSHRTMRCSGLTPLRRRHRSTRRRSETSCYNEACASGREQTHRHERRLPYPDPEPREIARR